MKVIVHLGFPKTASSTLQFGPLLDLERQSKISLFTWRKDDLQEPLEHRPSSRLFLKREILPEYLNFSDSKLNVLSDESFTAPVRLRKCNFGADIESPFLFPELIRKQIIDRFPNTDIQICWLGVIRNQRELVQSQYVEEYNWKRHKGVDLLFDSRGEVDLNGYEVYHFSEYMQSLEKLSNDYGDDIRFFLYEDMIGDPVNTYKYFDSIFESPNGFFYSSFKGRHINKKLKTIHGTFTKDGRYFVPVLPASVGDEIANVFYESNAQLRKFFSHEKLKAYGYVRA